MAVNAHLVCLSEDMVVNEVKKNSTNNLKLWISTNWQAILSEFLSTKLLVLIGCMCCVPIAGFQLQPPLFGPLGFGFIVLMNIQIFGHISGAYMNPAVTLAAVIWKKISVTLGIAYFIAQCTGAIIGYGILVALSESDFSSVGVCVTQPVIRYTVFQALGYEIALTLALVLINCAVWDPINEGKHESNSIKFGITVAGLSIAGGPLTGASMNPARSLGPALWTNSWKSHWIYWVGPLSGSVLAAVFYKIVFLKSERKMFSVISKFEEKH